MHLLEGRRGHGRGNLRRVTLELSDESAHLGVAGRDAVMRALIAELERDSHELAVPMPAAAAKQMHFRAYASAKSRNLDGTALRRSS